LWLNGTRKSRVGTPRGPPLDTATVIVRAPGTVLNDVVVRGAARHGFLLHAANIRLSRCEASANAADGVHVTEATGVQITACNLFGNAGPGVNNTGMGAVDARDNWWGSPAGPTAANSDGVAGLVDYVPYLDSPAAGAGTLAPIRALSSPIAIRTKPLWALHSRPRL